MTFLVSTIRWTALVFALAAASVGVGLIVCAGYGWWMVGGAASLLIGAALIGVMLGTRGDKSESGT